ncbi:MAG: amidohydrolase [Microcella sp.]|uniref:amidohydrolase n=1 Tax=Microcella sp. TaxID=1913979 RepID=UPI003314BB53
MPHADLLFTGGVVYAGPGRGSVPEALEVAVVDGRVAAIDTDLGEWRGAETEVIDLAGGMLHAGFVDAHIHPIQGGLERLGCDLTSGSTAGEYLEIIARHAAEHPARADVAGSEWITGGGWSMSAFPGGTPTAEALDAVVPDRPVLLFNRDHHGAWANSAALRVAGVDASTPDPADGRIERDAEGRATGTLHEGATRLVSAFTPPTTTEDERAALLEAQRYLHSVGVTGWQDAIVGSYFGASDTALIYAGALESGELTADVVGALWWDRDRGIEQVPELVARRDALAARLGPAARFRLTAVKIMADGVVENGTASMLEPYVGPFGAGEHPRGLAFVGGKRLTDAIIALDAAGMSVHVHTIGDRAVRETLDAFLAARSANDWSARSPVDPRRHHLAHLQFVHPDDAARFAEIGVTANAQAVWACNEPQVRDLTLPVVGAERGAQQYPFASILRARGAQGSEGAQTPAAAAGPDARPLLCAGSDWPVSTPDPWQAIHVAVNRRLPADDPAYDAEPLLAHEALTLAGALDAYTAGSSWINGRGPGDATPTGVITVGAVADLAATDRDPFAGPAESIHATRCVGTWVAGRRVSGGSPSS